MNALLKLLAAITNLTRAGGLRNIEQVYKIAKRELGDKFNVAKKQIDDAFKQGKEQKKLDDRTKDLKKTDEQGIQSLESDMKSIEQSTEKLKKIAEKNKADSDDIFALKSDPVKTNTPLQKKLTKAVEEAKQQIKEIGSLSDAAMQKEQIRNALKLLRGKRVYEMGSGLEGDVRTALRQFVKKEVKEGRLDIPDSYEKKMIIEDRQGGVDPIDVFRKAYGEDALIAVDDIFEQYGNSLTGPTYRDIEENFRKLFKMNRGFYDMAELPVPKETYGFEEGVRSIDSVEEDLINQYKQLDELDKFEIPKNRKSNSMGGINRIGFADGPKDPKKKALIDAIKKIPKVGKIVGGAVEIINYVKTLDPIEAMKEVNKVITRKGKYKNVTEEDSQKIFEDTQDHIFEREYKPTEFEIDDDYIDAEEIESAKKLAPKMVERLQIKAKYPGIDDNLVDKILIDDNPQRKAEVLATLDEAFRMMEKGKNTDEIIDTFKNQNRTKQAMGTGPEGLSEITGLYEKIKEKNKIKNAEKKSDQQIRYRKLITSNQFPELNKFFKSKLKENDLNLEPRVNASIGGPFTNRKQQSYIDFLGRRGVGAGAGTGTSTGGTYGTFSNSTPASGGAQPGTGTGTGTNTGIGTGITPPATGGGTGGTSGGNTGGSTGGNFQPNTGVTGGGSGGGSKVFFQPSGGSSSGGGKTSAGFSFSKKEDADKDIFADIDPAAYYKASVQNELTNKNPFNQAGYNIVLSPNQVLNDHQQYKASVDGTFDDMWKFYEDNKSLISEARRKNKSLRNLTADEYIQQFEDQSKNYGQTADDMAMYDMYGDIQNLNPKFYNKDGSLKMVLGEDGEYVTAREAAGLEKGVRDKKDFLGAIEYLGFDDEELENLRNPFLSTEEKESNYQKKLDEIEKENIGDGSIVDTIDEQMRRDAKLEFYKEQGKIPQDATSVEQYAGVTFSPRDANLNKAFNEHMKAKFGDSKENAREEYRKRLAESYGIEKPGEDSRTDFYDKVSSEYAGGGADQSVLNLGKLAESNEIQNLRKEVGFENITERTSKEQKKSFLRSISDFASKYKVPLTIVASLVGGPAGAQLAKQVLGANEFAQTGFEVVDDIKEGDLKGAAETVAGTVVGKNTIDNIKEGAKVLKEGDLKGAVGLGTDIALGKGAGNVVRKVLGTDGNQTNEQTAQTNEQTVQEQENQKVAKKEDYDGDISSIFFSEPQQLSKGGRVNKALGGPIDLEARKKQSQLDYLARQPGAQPAQPQPPAVNPQQPAVNPQQPAVNPQPPTQAPSPFDMSKYQGGTFTGGIEDSRNIALSQLDQLGIDTSKYSKMTATDTSGPKFQGLSLNEIFAMDENTAKETLGFDPAVEGSNAEFEEFLRVNDPGPQMIGPGGPAGMITEFMNQDELSQILNRAIPSYMQYAQEIGEDYTLDEMLAMSDDELAMIEDRYLKKMEIGQYAKRPGGQYNQNPGNLTPQKTTEVQMKELIGTPGRGRGNSLTQGGYMKGGRVGFSSGSERKRINSNMEPDYSNPFSKLNKIHTSKEKAFTNSLFKRNKKIVAAEKKRKRNLSISNEQARAKALQRLDLLKRLYASGKR